MSFGNLNILMHKTWHVWRQDNIEKVLKDEREDREKKAALKAEQIQREREARYERMGMKGKRIEKEERRELKAEAEMDKAMGRAQEKVTRAEQEPLQLGNVNFFADIERKEKREGRKANEAVKPHPETEAEKRVKEEREQQIFTMYLGAGSIETAKQKPWWAGGPTQKEKPSYAGWRAERTKTREDPLSTMNKLLGKPNFRPPPKKVDAASREAAVEVKSESRKRKRHHSRSRRYSRRSRSSSSPAYSSSESSESSSDLSSSSSHDRSQKHRKSKSKSRKRHSHKHEKKRQKRTGKEKDDELAALRAERAQREREEEKRVHTLTSPPNSTRSSFTGRDGRGDRPRGGYNNQYRAADRVRGSGW